MSYERTGEVTIPSSKVEDMFAAMLYQVCEAHDNEDVEIKFSPWNGKSKTITFKYIARSREEVQSITLNGKSST